MLVHGFTGSGASWRSLAPVLAPDGTPCATAGMNVDHEVEVSWNVPPCMPIIERCGA